MKTMISRFFLAVSFLSILPGSRLFSGYLNHIKIESELSKSSVFFPMIGLIIGSVLAALYQLLPFTPIHPVLHDFMILMAWIILSGALHLEGLADMVDGFSGGKNKEDIIRIMKDGAIGAKGAIALILLIMLKYLLLSGMDHSLKTEGLLLAPVAGRWGMVLAGYWGKPASSKNTLTRMFTLHLGKKELFIATFLAMGISFYFLSFQCLYLFLLTGLITRSLVLFSNHRIQGICGDVLGAINEINETAVLFLFSFSLMMG